MSPFSSIFVPDELAAALSDEAWLVALLDAERALVEAEAQAGLVPAATAAAVAAVLRPERYDIAELSRAGRAPGNPVEPLVEAIRVETGDELAGYVHLGATSQDILDTAAMLVATRALRIVDESLGGAVDACARLAEEHRNSVMAARTLLQQAVPTTFGFKAAGWLVGLIEARERLASVVLPAQLGGAAGTLAVLGEDGTRVLGLYAAALDLREPTVPWHTIRTPTAQLGAALAGVAGSAAKVAGDVILLAQTEVAEVKEEAGGASSTMPHKRNPVGAVLAVANARHARANAWILVESLESEHERAAGAWHAEWHALTSALAAAGGAVAALRRSLDGLEVDRERMRANVSASTLSEAERAGIAVTAPEDYLGSASAFVDRALGLYRR